MTGPVWRPSFRWLPLAGVVLMMTPAGARQAVPIFRAGVDVVQLDVSVLDKRREPVRGLQAGDFTVTEDGVSQPIVAFSSVDVPVATVPAAAWMASTPADVTTNQTDGRRLFVILMDDATVQPDLFALHSAKDAAARVIQALGPDDLAAVVFTRDNRRAQDFTSDHAKLLAATEAFSLGFRERDGGALPGVAQSRSKSQTIYFEFSIDTLDEVAHVLAGAPGRRKVVVYIGQGVPLNQSAEGEFVLSGPGADLVDHEIQVAMSEKVKRIFEEAARSNVTIYPIDICGLRSYSGGTCASRGELEYLQILADNTGGRATINTNNFAPGIAQIFAENRSYYLLGYHQLAPKAEGHFVHLDVKVDRPGLEVRARHYGYNAATDASRAAKAGMAPPPATVEALAGLLPNADIGLRIAAMPLRRAGTAGSVVLSLGVVRPPSTNQTADTLDVLVAAFTTEGEARGTVRETLTVPFGPSTEADTALNGNILAAMDLKPGRYALRVSVHSRATNRDGSVYTDVEVPDFADAPLSLSGAFIGTSGAALPPTSPVASLVPFAPTTRRTFERTDHVRAWLRVYEGGTRAVAPLVLGVRLVDAHDREVLGRAYPATTGQFGPDRAAGFTYVLPISTLASGDYVLGFTTSLGKTTATREVRFSVK